jgi:ABC-type antimicrobial peptide transport system permease subunit
MLAAALASQRVRGVIASGMVSIGVASTLIMVALSTGARLELQALQQRTGKNLFVVRAGERPVPAGRGNGWFVSSRLEPKDAALIEARVSAVAHAVPVRERSVLVKLGSKRISTTVRGVTPEFLQLRNFEVEAGRAFDDADRRESRRVALVGPFVKERLLEGASDRASILGAILRVGGVPFEVIGELRAKGTGTDGSDQDDQILVPFETAMHRLDNVESVSQVLVQARDAARVEEAIDSVRSLLRNAHYIEPAAREDFDILTLIQQDNVQRLSGRWMQGLARVLAIVTVVLGGAGVFAVSYLNVKERTGEIGLRMAIGATRGSVAGLFVAEACVLSAIGGVAGVGIGALVASLLRAVTSWAIAIDPSSIGIPLAVSAAIGVMCSLAPAWSASRVMPARALAG